LAILETSKRETRLIQAGPALPRHARPVAYAIAPAPDALCARLDVFSFE